MTDLIVQRGNGDIPGDDIIEPLLATVSAALARGCTELDTAEPADEVRLDIVFSPAILPGHLLDVHDATQGASWKGKVLRVSHRRDGEAPVTAITMLKPA